MRLGLDIDGTITSAPNLFAQLSHRTIRNHGNIHVVTSRTAECRAATREELCSYGITYNTLYFIPPMSAAMGLCPHADLTWYEKYLWGKVAYALEHDLTHFVDDDTKVASLFRRYAGNIRFFLPSEVVDAGIFPSGNGGSVVESSTSRESLSLIRLAEKQDEHYD